MIDGQQSLVNNSLAQDAEWSFKLLRKPKVY